MTRMPVAVVLAIAAGMAVTAFAPRRVLGQPSLVVLREDALRCAVRRADAGEAPFAAARVRLVREADAALPLGPWSVVQDTIVPPSGDRHDYSSFAPGYWPDSTRPGGLPYVWRDGVTNEALRRGTDADHRGRMASAVQTMALAYRFTGRRVYAERAALLIRTCFVDTATRMTPRMEYGQSVRGVNAGRMSGVLDLHDFIPVLDATALVAPSGAWRAADQAAMTAWARDLVVWLQTSDFGQRERATSNNHATWADATLAAFALYGGDRALARQTVERATTARIATQITPGGAMPEELKRTRTLGYSLFNLRAFVTLATIGERVGVDLWRYATPDGRGLQAALAYVVPYADPARRWPHDQLTPVPASDMLPLLLEGRRVYSSERYEDLLAVVGPLAPDDRAVLEYAACEHP